MIKLKYFFTFLLTFSFVICFAHKDFVVRKEFKNVKVSIKTGYNFEAIKKVLMIGELTSNLLDKLNYKDTIALDFIHIYTSKSSTEFFVSFDDGKIVFNSLKSASHSKTKGIFIRQIGNSFDIISTLKLVEYAVKNRSMIEKNQKSISYNKNFYDLTLNSIDSLKISKELSKRISSKVENVLKVKVFRPETEEQDSLSSGITYYLQNNKYYVVQDCRENSGKQLLVLENIFALNRIDLNSAMVFDSNNSFYYVNSSRNIVSKRHVVEKLNEKFKPFKFKVADDRKVGLGFTSYGGEILLLIYQINRDSAYIKIPTNVRKD